MSDLDGPSESSILKTLRDTGRGIGKVQVGNAIIPAILDEFNLEGPEIQGVRGLHHCIVTTPARMNVSEAREASHDRLFQPLVAHAIAAQLIQAVAFMHSCGIVHAGE
jgi:serine/threonine-protein kinase SRPK3